jgi:hypothetical protein
MSGTHHTPPSVSTANFVHQLSFDQARLIRHHRHLAANGIDPSGEPPMIGSNGLPPCNISLRHASGRKGGHPFVMCTALTVLLHPQACATHVRLAIDPYVYVASPFQGFWWNL